MKTVFVALLLACSFAQAQDVDTIRTQRDFYADTLTASRDTIDVRFLNEAHMLNYFVITAYTTTGTDTIDVYTKSTDQRIFSQVALTDLNAGSAVARIIITTTPKEYFIPDPDPVRIRLVCPDVSASIVFTLGGKHKRY